MMYYFIRNKERALGISKQTRKYDLPLNKDGGSTFLKTLMAFMTVLAIFALTGSFALSALGNKWISGLANKATVEIPADTTEGTVLEQTQIDFLTKDIHSFLKEHPSVENVEIMSREEIRNLISPWLGDTIEFDSVPLPGIITIYFKKDSAVNYNYLESRLKTFSPQVRLDDHSTWLGDILRFTGALNFIAVMTCVLIGGITIILVSGAIYARMEIYHEELELLHLMGASDDYIAKQMQRYSFFTCLQGGLIGLVIGLLCIASIGLYIRDKDINLLPSYDMSPLELVTIMALPLIVALIGYCTCRHTVLRVLAKMP